MLSLVCLTTMSVPSLFCLLWIYVLAFDEAEELAYVFPNDPHMLDLCPLKDINLIVRRWIWLKICHLTLSRMSPMLLMRVL